MPEAHPAYRERIAQIHADLGIPSDYATARELPLQIEATDLVDAEPDLFGRQPRVTPATLRWWQQMKDAATTDGISLHIVSAFRSVEYQAELVQNKLAKGHTIEQILQVNAAPGYSEHHTGRALDLVCDDCEPLEEIFETTEAYAWLLEHGIEFNFSLSYPRNNPFGIAYEPWHWLCRHT